MRRIVASAAIALCACSQSGEHVTGIEAYLEIGQGVQMDRVRIISVRVGSMLHPSSMDVLLPESARSLKTGDTITLRFDDGDAGQTVSIRAQGLSNLHPVTSVVEGTTTLEARTTVRLTLIFSGDPTDGAVSAPDGSTPDASPDTNAPDRPSDSMCAPGAHCASSGSACSFRCPGDASVNCNCMPGGYWVCAACPGTSSCTPNGACSSPGANCTYACPGSGSISCSCAGGIWSCPPCAADGPQTCSTTTVCAPNSPCAPNGCFCNSPVMESCPGGNYICSCMNGFLGCLCCGPGLLCPNTGGPYGAICSHHCLSRPGTSVGCSCAPTGGSWTCAACP